MVNKRSMGGMVAAFSLLFAFPALSSAHTLSVSVGRSQCVTPLSGQYTATVTITEAYFSGTVENIPAGQNVHELSTSTGKGNSGLNQNYFTTGAMGTQTGPVNLGQPTSFTSPASGDTAALHFTVTTSVPETYVLQNSYMHSPATGTITAPASGCTPPPSCPSGQTLVNGVCVPPTSCPAGQTLTAGVCVPPASCPAGQTLTAGKCQPPTSCPTGQILSGGQCTPPTSCPNGQVLSGGQCQPPSSCPTGQTLSGGQCTPPTSCPADTTMTGSVCAKATVVLPPAKIYPGVCQASTRGYTVRAGQQDTIIVSVHRHGAAVAGAKVRITLPGGQVVSRTTGRNGKATFTVAPTRSGTIFVRSPSCKEMVRVKVYAAKAATVVRAPSFTG
jgi:hypothetical protein